VLQAPHNLAVFLATCLAGLRGLLLPNLPLCNASHLLTYTIFAASPCPYNSAAVSDRPGPGICTRALPGVVRSWPGLLSLVRDR